ncbi:DNA polymerase [Sodalis ligni]|uniref:DNA polymerase family A n=1 Tax=Sodalis ligni TaxID=2697027 RepID=A0A4R1NLX2_9GAMM|nr:DNA polymerase [Sodalis ligni]TCL06981.1 DNA polymerase family A [Sodalis ligni]
MISTGIKVFLFLKDYAELGNDKYFLLDQNGFSEVSAGDISSQSGLLVCHDYWLIAPSLVKRSGVLPPLVVDVDEFQTMISGSKQDRRLRDRKDLTRRASFFGIEPDLCREYFEIFNRSTPFDFSIYRRFGEILSDYWKALEETSTEKGEIQRFRTIEQPVSRYLITSLAKGIAIDTERLHFHKGKLDHDFYTALKEFSAKHNVPLEVPDDYDVISYLEPKGFDFTGVDVDYILKFVPMNSSYAKDVLYLRKLAQSRKVLNAIPVSNERVYPLVDVFGSITSRIYLRDPSLQNLAKRHRDILRPDGGKKFIYVDYDQYEVGIMAALSEDERLLALYSEGDMYEALAKQLFSEVGKRKHAKRLFLSYAYGMSIKSLVDAAASYGADRAKTKILFKSFSVFEQWKEKVWQLFLANGKIGTDLGNFLVRSHDGPLQGQEKRSAISQVVQGTASLIFKKALIAMSDHEEVELKLPMHDAVLAQVPEIYDTSLLTQLLASVMTKHFNDHITGKASLELFFLENSATEF